MLDLISSIAAIVFAVSFHEFCHAWMADRLGDPTGRFLGRLTLNPLKHFDPIGTLSLFFFGIGWGKPVPFNPENLRFPKRDSALIALAGPAANFLTALACAIPLKYLANTGFQNLPLYILINQLFSISVLLFSFNMLPFPPFDGSKIVGLFVPHRYHWVYDAYLRDGVQYVIFFILFDAFFLKNALHFSVLDLVVSKMYSWVKAIILVGT